MSEKFSSFAKNGMVVSSQPLATLAGVRILMDGGNAIDAAVATAAVLGVVEPSSLGIGGDAFALFYSAKDKAPKALDASGRSPYAANLDFCRNSGFTGMPQRGIHSVTVPGAVHGWSTVLSAYGTMPLRKVLQAAIQYSEEGFPVTELTAESWHESEAMLKADEGASINYLVNGRAPRAGASKSAALAAEPGGQAGQPLRALRAWASSSAVPYVVSRPRRKSDYRYRRAMLRART